MKIQSQFGAYSNEPNIISKYHIDVFITPVLGFFYIAYPSFTQIGFDIAWLKWKYSIWIIINSIK